MVEVISETSEQKIIRLEKNVAYLSNKVALYEDGEQSLYRSLQKKMNEISKFLNDNPLGGIQIDDKSKSFERIFLVLERCEKLANSVKAFGEIAGVIDVNKEEKKTICRKYC